MGAVGTKYNIVDIATAKGPDGNIMAFAEVLNKSNPMMQHIPWKEGNLDTGERIGQRTSLGTPEWRRINDYVTPTKSTKTQLDEVTGLLEEWSVIDEKLLKMSNDPAGLLLSESKPLMEGMAQEVASTMLWGNITTSPREFHGFFSRLDTLNSDPTKGPIVISAGGASTDNTSILMCKWGMDKVYGIYPKGSKAGLEFNPIGMQTDTSSTGGKRRVHETQLIWECGLAIKDFRYVSAIRNIDISALDSFENPSSDTAPRLFKYLNKLLSYMPDDGMHPYIYVSRDTWAVLSDMADSEKYRALSVATIDNQMITHFKGCPIYKMDGFVTETSVVTA